jgi:hypothetical protein
MTLHRCFRFVHSGGVEAVCMRKKEKKDTLPQDSLAAPLLLSGLSTAQRSIPAGEDEEYRVRSVVVRL